MRSCLALLGVISLSGTVACYLSPLDPQPTSDGAGSEGGPLADAGSDSVTDGAWTVDATYDAAVIPKPDGGMTWTYAYGAYIGASTPGHCGNVGCHDSAHNLPDGGTAGNFVCGADKATCYQGMVSRGIINLAKPMSSWLVSSYSVVVWFNPKGFMPLDNVTPNAAAKADILAWLNAGAPNN